MATIAPPKPTTPPLGSPVAPAPAGGRSGAGGGATAARPPAGAGAAPPVFRWAAGGARGLPGLGSPAATGTRAGRGGPVQPPGPGGGTR
jgi:hypothetical protein